MKRRKDYLAAVKSKILEANSKVKESNFGVKIAKFIQVQRPPPPRTKKLVLESV